MTRGRRIGLTALIVSATLVWTVAALGVWAKRQVLDNKNWVDTSSELLGDEPIRTAVGLYLVDQVWDTDAVEPPRMGTLVALGLLTCVLFAFALVSRRRLLDFGAAAHGGTAARHRAAADDRS